MYRPSTFGLIEFDAAQLQPAHQPGLRWLASWEGPAGGPSTQVTLGWADGEGCAVVVATSSLARLPHKSQRREEAVVQGLRRNRLPLPTAVSADQVEQAIERARTTADWHPSIVLADGLVCTGAVSTVHGVLVGHARVGTSVVTLAAVGLSADQIRFRTLACAGGYGADPLKNQPAQRVAEHRPELRSGG